MGIGIADHIPLLPEPDPEVSMGVCDLGDYVEEVQELKEASPGYVLLGIEADYRPDTVSDVGSLLDSHPFDYAIGSVHHLGTWSFDDLRQIDEYDDRDIDDIWIEYFELVGDAAESGLFTILGHLDLVKKFGYRPTRVLNVELDLLVERIARAGVLVEINTAGLHGRRARPIRPWISSAVCARREWRSPSAPTRTGPRRWVETSTTRPSWHSPRDTRVSPTSRATPMEDEPECGRVFSREPPVGRRHDRSEEA